MTSPTVAAMAAPPNTISPSQRTAVGLIRSAPNALKAKTEPMPPATDSAIPTRYAQTSRLRIPSDTSPASSPQMMRPAPKPPVRTK